MSAEVPEKTGGGTSGRSSGSESGKSQTGSNGTTMQYSSRHGTVVIRATVEHIGVVGDTEMTVQVKWPASSFCAPCSKETTCCEEQSSDTAEVPETGPGAYIIHATAPPCGTATEKRDDGKGGAASTSSDHPEAKKSKETHPKKTEEHGRER